MNLFTAIKEELLSDLPGLEFHNKLAPKHTKLLSGEIDKNNAAVCIVILSCHEKQKIIFIKRTIYDGHHSGQISFPGGKEEKSDNSLYETARRECFEEIGIKLSQQHYLGKLSPLFIPVSGFMVYPFVFYYPCIEEKEFIIDTQEVEYPVFFNLNELLIPDLLKTTKIKLEKSRIISAPYYDIKNEIVWGATAMILSEFIEILKRIKSKYRVSDL